MQRRRFAVVLIVIAVVAGYLLWPRAHSRDARIEGSGTIEATQVDVAPKVAGRVIRLRVRDGDRVSAGQVVAELDTAESDAQVEQARAGLEAAQSRLAQAEVALSLQQAQYDASVAQAQAAVEVTQTRVPQAEESVQLQIELVNAQVEQARAQVRSAASGLEAIEASVRASEANVQVAEANFNRAESDRTRLEGLYREGAISAQQLDAARTAVAAATAQRDAVRAQRDAVRTQRQAADAALRQAQAALSVAEANRRTINIRRQEALASRAQLEQARAALASARAGFGLVVQRKLEVETARAGVAQARAALDLALIARGHAMLQAPISGVVVARSVEAGDLISVGAPVLTIADLSRVYLRVFVSETDLGKVKLGQPVEVRVDAFPGRIFQGTVAEISNRAEFTPGNVQTQEERVKLVFAVRVSLANSDGVLKPGLPADAVILTTPASGR